MEDHRKGYRVVVHTDRRVRVHEVLATVTVLWIGGAALIPRAAVAPAMGRAREQGLLKI